MTDQGRFGRQPETGTGWTTYIPHHRTGPEQDHAARLTVVRSMMDQHSLEEMAEVLDMLALLPGQEEVRAPGDRPMPKTLPGEGTCGPKSQMGKVYVPN